MDIRNTLRNEINTTATVEPEFMDATASSKTTYEETVTGYVTHCIKLMDATDMDITDSYLWTQQTNQRHIH